MFGGHKVKMAHRWMKRACDSNKKSCALNISDSNTRFAVSSHSTNKCYSLEEICRYSHKRIAPSLDVKSSVVESHSIRILHTYCQGIITFAGKFLVTW